MPSAFENLIGMFNKPTTPAAAVPATPPGSQVPASGPAQGSNIPAFQQSATLPPKEVAPLAEYADLFNNAPIEGAEVPVGLDDPYLVVDKDKVKEFVNSKSFVGSNPEQLALVTRALGGDVQAFVEVLEGFGRNLYMDSAINSTHVAERIARTGVSRLHAAIPQQMRSLSSAEKMTELNPLFNNPALKPLADAMKSQFEAKHPTATPLQIAEMTAKYFQDTGVMFNPAPAATQTKTPTGSDFSGW